MYIAGGKYYLTDVIASGSYGKVYASYPYAIKYLTLPTKGSSKTQYNLRKLLANEIKILTELDHLNIVKLYEVIYEKDRIYLVMEYCQSDLRLLRKYVTGEKKATEVIRQVLAGCKEMVRLNIVHRDLKPANILINNGVYKIADFGMAKFVYQSEDSILQSHVGTPYYMSPQILQRLDYTRKCDIWSLGVIYYEMIFGRLPWDGKNEQILLENIISIPLRFPGDITANTRELLYRMLMVSYVNRIGWDYLFKLFELQDKREQAVRVHTYHRSIIGKLVQIERERIARIEYKCGFHELTNDYCKHVMRVLERMFHNDDLYLLKEFSR